MSESSNSGSESGNDEIDEFDAFDAFDEEAMTQENEAIEKQQKSRIAGISDRINGIQNGLKLEADSEIEVRIGETTNQTGTPHRGESEEKKPTQLDQGAIESTTTDSLETLQRNWKMGGLSKTETTELEPSTGLSSVGKPEKNFLGTRSREQSTSEKSSKKRKPR